MKNFVWYIAKILLLLLLIAIGLDCCFTTVFKYSNKRNKIENVINTKNKEFDIIIMGSSRANNHFVPKIFNEKGFKSFNYGISGAKLQETALLLQLMIENNYKIKNIILEVDLNINSDSYSIGNRAKFMPYINDNKIISNYYNFKLDNYNTIKYIPFYRYIKFENQIGCREMFFSLIKRKSNSLNNYGFYPLTNQGKNMSYDLTKMEPKKNASYELIKNICKIHNIKLIAITTPMCKNIKGSIYFEKIRQLYPEILPMENLVKDDKYFSSCGHLNNNGARLFTKKVFETIKNDLKR